MRNLLRFRNLVVAVGLVASQGCKSDNVREADRAADKVTDKQADLRDARNEHGKKVIDQVDKSKDLVEKSGDLAEATDAFEHHRAIRIQALRAELSVIATQPRVIDMLANGMPLTEPGRADVAERLKILQMRRDELRNLIKGLETVNAADWRNRDDAVNDAMHRLDDAREDAWKALDHAPRTDHSS